MNAFVLIGTQRTGTTLIRTSLDSHPGIRCAGEVFKDGKRPYKEADGYWAYRKRSTLSLAAHYLARRKHVAGFLDQLLGAAAAPMAGFKLMYSHALKYPETVDYVRTHRLKAIHVLRRNFLKTLVSREMARHTGVYHRHGEPREAQVRPLTLQTADLVRRLEEIAGEEAQWQEMIYRDVTVHRVFYEDFVADRDGESGRLLDFLGFGHHALESSLVKLNAGSMNTLIANYIEVEAALAGTPFAPLLNAPDP